MPCCSGLSKSNALRVEDRAAGVREGVKTRLAFQYPAEEKP